MSDNGWESVRRDRLVKNELAFRDHNNRRAGVEEQAGDDVEDELVPFVCECGSAGLHQPGDGDGRGVRSSPLSA